jgi:SAM-dependent methyltransferase
MEFTGERFVPGCSQQLAYEHYHRYLFARRLTAGLSVLDLACGEGYGTSLLASAAKSVMGIDIDPAAIGYASRRYPLANIEFRACDCTDLKGSVADASMDAVVMFEAIEHLDHEGQHRALGEVKRVLRPGGILLASSPNKPLYRKISCPDNEYHLNELLFEEFGDLLGRHFSNTRFFGQRVECASMLWPLGPDDGRFTGNWDYLGQDDAPLQGGRTPEAGKALYFIGVCSDRELPEAAGGLLVKEDMSVMHDKDKRLEETARLEADVKRLSKDIEDIYSSHSWKVTAPLRKVMGMLKRKDK